MYQATGRTTDAEDNFHVPKNVQPWGKHVMHVENQIILLKSVDPENNHNYPTTDRKWGEINVKVITQSL